MRPQIINGTVRFPRHVLIDRCPKGSLVKVKHNGPLLTVDGKGEDGYTVCLKKQGTVRLSEGYPVILYS